MGTNLEILVMGENLTVVQVAGAIEFMPYVMRGTETFDPQNNFRPVAPRPKQKSLGSQFHNEALTLIQSAKCKWKPTEAPKSAEPANVPEQPKQAATSTPSGEFERLIAESIAKISSDAVLKQVQPMLNDFIKSEYGMLPKVIEIKTPTHSAKIQGLTHSKFETILNLVSADIPVFLTGAAGTGKNVICKQVSEAMKKEFYFSNAVTQEYKLTGFIDANGRYHETQFYKAFTNGGIFMLDEIDASTPEVLVILNAAIANRYFDFPTGRVDAHVEFRLLAAGNTYGTGADIEYTGRYQLDASSLDRFAIIEIDYDKNIEEAIAGHNMELVEFTREFRKTVQKAGIKFVVSYRSIERLTKLESLFDVEEAIKIALLRGMAKDDVKMVSQNIGLSGNKYCSAFKRLASAS